MACDWQAEMIHNACVHAAAHSSQNVEVGAGTEATAGTVAGSEGAEAGVSGVETAEATVEEDTKLAEGKEALDTH